MDNNTAKVLLAAIPSTAFVIIVALVIFGLSPGDCIEIEAPGGGKVTRCKPTPEPISALSEDQVNSLLGQIEELKTIQETQQQQRLASLKQRGLIDEVPDGFMTASSIFQENRDSLYQQIKFLSHDQADNLSDVISSDKQKITQISNTIEDLINEGKGFTWTNQWNVKGKIGVLGLSYEGQITFNNDNTFESHGTLDGEPVGGSGTFLINEKLGTCTLFPQDAEQTQYYFIGIGEDSFVMWSPFTFEELEFRKIS